MTLSVTKGKSWNPLQKLHCMSVTRTIEESLQISWTVEATRRQSKYVFVYLYGVLICSRSRVWFAFVLVYLYEHKQKTFKYNFLVTFNLINCKHQNIPTQSNLQKKILWGYPNLKIHFHNIGKCWWSYKKGLENVWPRYYSYITCETTAFSG